MSFSCIWRPTTCTMKARICSSDTVRWGGPREGLLWGFFSGGPAQSLSPRVLGLRGPRSWIPVPPATASGLSFRASTSLTGGNLQREAFMKWPFQMASKQASSLGAIRVLPSPLCLHILAYVLCCSNPGKSSKLWVVPFAFLQNCSSLPRVSSWKATCYPSVFPQPPSCI